MGKAVYGQDIRIDGMLTRRSFIPPVYGSTVKNVDDAATLKIGGVKQTITLDPWKPPVGMQALGGVAVVADNTWAAFQGKKKLKVQNGRKARIVPGTPNCLPQGTGSHCKKALQSCTRGRRCGQGFRQRRQSDRSGVLRAYADWHTRRWNRPRHLHISRTEKWLSGRPRKTRKALRKLWLLQLA